MVERNAAVAPEKRIDFRIGVNLGDVIVEENDIFGDGVNIAARLEALAEPGGICVSRVVRDQTRDKLSYSFEDKGAQSVKNIGEFDFLGYTFGRMYSPRTGQARLGQRPSKKSIKRVVGGR